MHTEEKKISDEHPHDQGAAETGNIEKKKRTKVKDKLMKQGGTEAKFSKNVNDSDVYHSEKTTADVLEQMTKVDTERKAQKEGFKISNKKGKNKSSESGVVAVKDFTKKRKGDKRKSGGDSVNILSSLHTDVGSGLASSW